MRALIQRTLEASVKIDQQTVGEIDSGFVILLGITNEDTEKEITWLVEKIINLRLFKSTEGKHFDKSLKDTEKSALIVSQFTLYASCKKGRRPDFNNAAKPEVAEPLYEKFIEKMRIEGINVQTGRFGADMHVTLVNDGPVTIILDTNE